MSDNASTGTHATPSRTPGTITIHGFDDFAAMRRAGRLAAETLDFIEPAVIEGMTTEELDRLCHDFIVSNGAVPAPLNYRGFPKSICTSINDVVCHGIPDGRELRDGDVVNVDVTVILDGWHGDTSRMFWVGKPSQQARILTDTTFDAMWAGIKTVRPGVTLGDVGHAIQTVAESKGFSVVRAFCGHGIGRVFHDEPVVLHHGVPGEGLKLREGMFFTIEPMLNVGKPDVRILDDEWTAVTRDRSLSAQFEHTIGVMPSGCEVFTTSPSGRERPGLI